jgi:hypothetical protein
VAVKLNIKDIDGDYYIYNPEIYTLAIVWKAFVPELPKSIDKLWDVITNKLERSKVLIIDEYRLEAIGKGLSEIILLRPKQLPPPWGGDLKRAPAPRASPGTRRPRR